MLVLSYADLKLSGILLPLGHTLTMNNALIYAFHVDTITINNHVDNIHVDMPTDINGKPYEVTREMKAQRIVWTKGQIKRYNENHYVVQSQSGSGAYVVISTETGWN